MPSITIRNLEEDVKQCLRIRAAAHGHSMEEEAREILRRALSESAPAQNLTAAIRARIRVSDRMDTDLPAREAMREPPHFDEA